MIETTQRARGGGFQQKIDYNLKFTIQNKISFKTRSPIQHRPKSIYHGRTFFVWTLASWIHLQEQFHHLDGVCGACCMMKHFRFCNRSTILYLCHILERWSGSLHSRSLKSTFEFARRGSKMTWSSVPCYEYVCCEI